MYSLTLLISLNFYVSQECHENILEFMTSWINTTEAFAQCQDY